ncbi:MAG: DoxX protein [Verrucomicrobia bacterium]|nr:DoxX protein [Verrucomicrobiota bacterium]
MFLKILRILYGAALITFGLNGFFGFLPIPEKQGFALEFMTTLHHAGYVFPAVASIMLLSGTLLLLNRATLLGLFLMLPVSFNIFFFHLLHDRAALVVAWLLFALNMFHIFRHKQTLKLLLKGENIQ